MPHDQVCTCKAAVTECFIIKGITFHSPRVRFPPPRSASPKSMHDRSAVCNAQGLG